MIHIAAGALIAWLLGGMWTMATSSDITLAEIAPMNITVPKSKLRPFMEAPEHQDNSGVVSKVYNNIPDEEDKPDSSVPGPMPSPKDVPNADNEAVELKRDPGMKPSTAQLYRHKNSFKYTHGKLPAYLQRPTFPASDKNNEDVTHHAETKDVGKTPAGEEGYHDVHNSAWIPMISQLTSLMKTVEVYVGSLVNKDTHKNSDLNINKPANLNKPIRLPRDSEVRSASVADNAENDPEANAPPAEGSKAVPYTLQEMGEQVGAILWEKIAALLKAQPKTQELEPARVHEHMHMHEHVHIYDTKGTVKYENESQQDVPVKTEPEAELVEEQASDVGYPQKIEASPPAKLRVRRSLMQFEKPIEMEQYENEGCSHSHPLQCKDDNNYAKCLFYKSWKLVGAVKSCEDLVPLGFCHAKAFYNHFKKSCPETFYMSCAYVSLKQKVKHPETKFPKPDLEGLQKRVMNVFKDYNCEDFINTFGCISTNPVMTTTAIVKACPETYMKQCYENVKKIKGLSSIANSFAYDEAIDDNLRKLIMLC